MAGVLAQQRKSTRMFVAIANSCHNFPKSAGAYLNFDLAFPSGAIPADFFPSDEDVYGYKVSPALVLGTGLWFLSFFLVQDFGVWNITYQSVPCLSAWAGSKNAAALGSVKQLGSAGCCPADPSPGNDTNVCPSFSDQNGIPYVSFSNLLNTFWLIYFWVTSVLIQPPILEWSSSQFHQCSW